MSNGATCFVKWNSDCHISMRGFVRIQDQIQLSSGYDFDKKGSKLD